jgi:iron(III) transport system ATP-binding protein
VLLFDEPLSNLDARLRRAMRDEIRTLQQRLGVTVVYVTHDQSEALAVSDRIVVMDHARIAQQGSPRELYERPDTEFVARFMGEANLVSGTLHREGAATWVDLAGLRSPVDVQDVPPGPVRCALRPEAITLAASGEGLEATVDTAAYVGAFMEYRVSTALGSLFVVSTEGSEPLAPGHSARVRLRGRPIVLRS